MPVVVKTYIMASLRCREEHVGFSPIRQTLRAPNAKQGEKEGEMSGRVWGGGEGGD